MPMSDSEQLRNILQRTAPPVPPPTPEESEPDTLTVAQMDGKYSTMRPANKPLTRLHVVLKDGRVRSYQYSFLDSESTYEGGTFVLLFAGVKHMRLTVKGHGPLFWRIYDLISLHRWSYLREATGSMPGRDGETVFTSIEIKDVSPDRE